MENNYKEFEALRDRYRAMTMQEIKAAFKEYVVEGIPGVLTGYGNKESCTLCKAAGYVDTNNEHDIFRSVNCNQCIWVIATGNICCSFDNLDTFEAVDDAKTPGKLYEAYKNRANRMDEALQLYRDMDNKTNTTTKLESDKCPYCGSYGTFVIKETIEADEMISECECLTCKGKYTDIYDIKYNHTICTEAPN